MVNILKFFAAGGLIYWLVDRGLLNLSEVWELLHPFSTFVSLSIVGLHILCVVMRWRLILYGKGISITFFETLKLQLIGVFFNFAMPGSVGGDVVRGFYIAKSYPDKKLEAASTILLDRILGLYGMLVMSVLTIIWNIKFISSNLELKALATTIVIVFLGFTVVLGLAFSKKVRNSIFVERLIENLPGGKIIHRVYEVMSSYENMRKLFFRTLGISLLSHSFIVLLFLFVGHQLQMDNIGLAIYFFCVPLGLIATALPISPAGVGVGQVAMLGLFKMSTGVESSLGPMGMTVLQLSFLSWGLLGAYFYVQRGKSIKEIQAAKL